MSAPNGTRSLLALAALVAALTLFLNATSSVGGASQWDFRSHYFSALAYRLGENPYDNAVVNNVNSTPHAVPAGHAFPYHPYTLPYFNLYAALPYDAAVCVNFLVMLLCILGLGWSGMRALANSPPQPLILAIVALAGSSEAVRVALQTGNAAPLEALIIWLALFAFFQQRLFLFALLIGVAALLKLTPLAYLALILIAPSIKKSTRVLFFSVAFVAFALLWCSPLLLGGFMRDWFIDFVSYTSAVREHGRINPCSLALVAELFGRNYGFGTYFFYLLWVSVVVVPVAVLLSRKRIPPCGPTAIFLCVLTYALIAPRFKDYAYTQLFPLNYALSALSPQLLAVNLSPLLLERFELPALFKDYIAFYLALIQWCWLMALAWRWNGVEDPLRRFAKNFSTPSRNIVRSAGEMVLVVVLLAVTIPSLRATYRILRGTAKPLEVSGVRASERRVGAFSMVRDADFWGGALTVKGRTYASGIAAHAPSQLVFPLDGQFSRFEAKLAVLDTARAAGSVRFVVFGDGGVRFESPLISRGMEPVAIDVDVSEVKKLTLVADEHENHYEDHAVWLEPLLHTAGEVSAAREAQK